MSISDRTCPECDEAVDADGVTTVYRAYSPSRGEASTVTDDHQYAAGVAGTRNQHTAVDNSAADWIVQTGHIQWEQA